MYPCSENKGAGQLCYCTADLRLYFRIGKNLVFSWHGSYDVALTLDMFRYKIVSLYSMWVVIPSNDMKK